MSKPQQDFVIVVTRKMREFECKIAQLERENAQLRGQMEEDAITHSQVWTQLEETQQQVDRQQQLHNALTRELDESRQQADLQQELHEDLTIDLDGAQWELDCANWDKTDLQEQLDQATATEYELRAKLGKSDRVLRKAKALIIDQRNRIKETNDELARREEQIAHLTQQLDATAPIAPPPPYPASPQQLALESSAPPPPPAPPQQPDATAAIAPPPPYPASPQQLALESSAPPPPAPPQQPDATAAIAPPPPPAPPQQPDATVEIAAYEDEIDNLKTDLHVAELTIEGLHEDLGKTTQEVEKLTQMFGELQRLSEQDKAAHLKESKQMKLGQRRMKDEYDANLKKRLEEMQKAYDDYRQRADGKHAQAIQTLEDEHAQAIQILQERVQAMERKQVLSELQSQLHAYVQQGSEEQLLCDLEIAYNAQQEAIEAANADVEQVAAVAQQEQVAAVAQLEQASAALDLAAKQDAAMKRSWQQRVANLQKRYESDVCLIAFKLKSRRRLLELEQALAVSHDQLAVCRKDLRENENTLGKCNDALKVVPWAFMGPFLYRVGSTDNVNLDQGFVDKMFASPYRDFFDVVLKTYDAAASSDQLEFMDQQWENFEEELTSNAAAVTDPHDPTVVVQRLMAMVKTFAQKD